MQRSRVVPGEIRRAAPDDAPAVAAIEASSFPDPWTEADFRAAAEFPSGIFLVACSPETGAVVGYAIALVADVEVEILNIAVVAGERGRGLGGRLLDLALSEAGRAGAQEAFLEVRESNTGARALYASRGFELVGRRRAYYRKPIEDALVLRNALQR